MRHWLLRDTSVREKLGRGEKEREREGKRKREKLKSREILSCLERK
jgi:hypothetical protein